MTHPTTVRFDESEHRRLRRLAERRGTTVSELIRNAVRSCYFREKCDEAAAELMAYIEENPLDITGDADELDDDISRAMGDAAVR